VNLPVLLKHPPSAAGYPTPAQSTSEQTAQRLDPREIGSVASLSYGDRTMSTLKKEVAFIDANVADLDQLIAGLRERGRSTIVLNG
jgi:hypothetical protein